MRGNPVAPRLHLEATLHNSLWIRNYVRQHQGEAEADRQFAYLDNTLTDFAAAGFRVQTESAAPGREGSVDRPQSRGPQDKGQGPAE